MATVLVAVLAAAGLVAAGVLAGDRRGDPPADRPVASANPVGPPPGREPPPPPSGASDTPAGPPEVQVNQPYGDSRTSFVLHGRGWPPGSRVTIALESGVRSPDRPIVDRAGTFNHVVNARHEFFPGPLPPGPLTLVVTAGGERRASVSFQVNG